MRRKIIAGNWKMYKTNYEAIELINFLKRELGDLIEVDIVVCPPFTALSDMSDLLESSHIALGAQNLYCEEEGAFTGEVSAPMLKALGVKYCIIGHSERRQYFTETDALINKKIHAALKHGITPIVCVGEKLEEREANRTLTVIKKQCETCFDGISAESMKKVIIAYEPVWAIGTGKNATPKQAQEVHQFIRDILKKMYNSEELALQVRIQYGGSVKPENASDLMAQPDIDGALVGGASLNHISFSSIVKSSCGIRT